MDKLVPLRSFTVEQYSNRAESLHVFGRGDVLGFIFPFVLRRLPSGYNAPQSLLICGLLDNSCLSSNTFPPEVRDLLLKDELRTTPRLGTSSDHMFSPVTGIEGLCSFHRPKYVCGESSPCGHYDDHDHN